MKRWIALLLASCLLLGGCSLLQQNKSQQYTVTYLNLFDTVTTIIGYSETEQAFLDEAQKIYEQLLRYHQLFDIYNDYEGLSNLKTVNDHAGIEAVAVDSDILQLLQSCVDYHQLTDGKVNVAMGSVLRLWHEARETGVLPDMETLSQAALHTDISCLVLDAEASTAYLSDPETQLDVGAIAKGWAAQKVAEAAPEGMLISVGGNVCVTGPKDAEGTPWVIGVKNPDQSGDYLHTLTATSGAVVTSGDYQRIFTVENKAYHHIIDPETLMPSAYWRSVTVVCADSGLADALSTALFLLPLEEGRTLAKQCDAQALWLDANGNEYMTDGLEAMLRS